MLVTVVAAALALGLPGGPAVAQADQAAAGCGSVVAAGWTVAGGTYRVAAVATGRTCASANVTLTIRAPTGAVLLTFASAAADLPLLFAEAASPALMTAALRQWVRQPAGRTTRDLPPWEAGTEEPKAGDMLFHPEPLISRARYQELRKWAQPAFCFLQGAESEACYALDAKAETLTLIGTQTLPG